MRFTYLLQLSSAYKPHMCLRSYSYLISQIAKHGNFQTDFQYLIANFHGHELLRQPKCFRRFLSSTETTSTKYIYEAIKISYALFIKYILISYNARK